MIRDLKLTVINELLLICEDKYSGVILKSVISPYIELIVVHLSLLSHR